MKQSTVTKLEHNNRFSSAPLIDYAASALVIKSHSSMLSITYYLLFGLIFMLLKIFQHNSLKYELHQ